MERLLRVAEVAERLAVSEALVYKLMRTGRLPAVHIGGSLRFDPEQIRHFIEAGGAR